MAARAEVQSPTREPHDHDHSGGKELLSLTSGEQVDCLVKAALLLALGWFFEGVVRAPLLAEVAFWISLGFSVWTFLGEVVEHRVGVATLMVIGAVGAALLSAVHEGATLALLFGVSEAVIHHTFDEASKGLRSLLDLVPRRVTVLRDGHEVDTDPEDLVPGDLMVVKPGERIATDGVVASGSSSVDFSAVTGEPIAVEVYPGTAVHAAGVNGAGAITVEVAATSAQSSLSRLVQVLEAAQARRGSCQTFVDRVAAVLVPLALLTAAGMALFGVATGAFGTWVHRALLVLVAMSPCAFAIAVPVSVLASVGAASRSGALIKGGATLEALARVRMAAIDKTGTLTTGIAQVVEVIPVPGVSADEVLAVAAALESRSEHPLAGAMLAAAKDLAFDPAVDVEAVPGSGVVGSVGGERARLGRPGFVASGPLEEQVERLQGSGATAVLVERAGMVLGAIGVRDELRPEAPEAVAALRDAGLERVVMVTGDNWRAAWALGTAAGLDEVRAELLPQAKVAVVRELEREGPVLVVGDGINDAPALASAHVGVAMGAMGADLAVETADVALMGNDLRCLPALIRHARRTRRIVRQGFVLSAAVVLVLVPLAVAGAIGLAPMVLVHELSGVLIILNGLRAGRSTDFGRTSEAASVAASATARGLEDEEADIREETPVAVRPISAWRAAIALASVALAVGVGGVMLHRIVNRPDPSAGWARIAQPLVAEITRIDYAAVRLQPGQPDSAVAFSIDCAGARDAIERLARKVPTAPDDRLRRLVHETFLHKRRQYDACLRGDQEVAAVAERKAMSSQNVLGAQIAKSLGTSDGHTH